MKAAAGMPPFQAGQQHNVQSPSHRISGFQCHKGHNCGTLRHRVSRPGELHGCGDKEATGTHRKKSQTPAIPGARWCRLKILLSRRALDGGRQWCRSAAGITRQLMDISAHLARAIECHAVFDGEDRRLDRSIQNGGR